MISAKISSSCICSLFWSLPKAHDHVWGLEYRSMVNQKLCSPAQLPLNHNGPAQHLHYACRSHAKFDPHLWPRPRDIWTLPQWVLKVTIWWSQHQPQPHHLQRAEKWFWGPPKPETLHPPLLHLEILSMKITNRIGWQQTTVAEPNTWNHAENTFDFLSRIRTQLGLLIATAPVPQTSAIPPHGRTVSLLHVDWMGKLT